MRDAYNPCRGRGETALFRSQMPPRNDRKCSIEGCDLKHCGLGLCSLHYQRARSQSPKYKARNLERHRKLRADPEKWAIALAKERERLANFSPSLVESCRIFQRGLCAICKREMQPGRNSGLGECADHCHATGAPRGLLCRTCNTDLGRYEKIKDNAAKYLASPPVKQLGGLCLQGT